MPPLMPLPKSNPFQITFVFDRFDDRFAILKNGYGEIKWPLEKLPVSLQKGDSVNLKVTTKIDEENEVYTSRRKLLEELIN